MAEYLKAKLTRALLAHFGDDDRRIEHALRVTAWAEKILETEPGDREVVLATGLLHDTGITIAEALHGSASGDLQERYGPQIVRPILESIGLDAAKIDEVCAIVANHHTVKGVPGPNFPILWDADMLVNVRDELGDAGRERLEKIVDGSFRTPTGKKLARGEFLGD